MEFAERFCLGDKLRRQWQAANKETVIQEGGLVQVAFSYHESGKDGTEHMWILVERIKDETIYGRLMNVPTRAKYLKFKVRTSCKRSEIEEYEPPKKYQPKTP